MPRHLRHNNRVPGPELADDFIQVLLDSTAPAAGATKTSLKPPQIITLTMTTPAGEGGRTTAIATSSEIPPQQRKQQETRCTNDQRFCFHGVPAFRRQPSRHFFPRRFSHSTLHLIKHLLFLLILLKSLHPDDQIEITRVYSVQNHSRTRGNVFSSIILRSPPINMWIL